MTAVCVRACVFVAGRDQSTACERVKCDAHDSSDESGSDGQSQKIVFLHTRWVLDDEDMS